VSRLVAALFVTLALVSEARAARWAVVIGANRGDPDMPTLRYAERDAARMGEVLVRLGGVAADHLLVLAPGSADALRRDLAAFGERVRGDGSRALLVLYYSGHADQANLLVGGTRLPFAELKGIVRGLGAELTIMIADACRSAGLITAKGGLPITPFDLGLATPDVQGLAIVTSSSASEDAQESERLGGGVFTHHLVAGLMGAADTSRDGRVALTELYGYAYGQTRLTTAGSPIEQHPAFAFDLRGEADIVMTEVGADRQDVGRLTLTSRGRWLVFDRAAGGRLAVEVDVEGETTLALAPGAYLVRRVVGPLAGEDVVVVAPGLTQSVGADALEPIPFRHGIRKGYGQLRRRAWSTGGAFDVTAPWLDDTNAIGALAITGQLDLAALSVTLRLRLGGGSHDNHVVHTDQWIVGLDLGAYHLFDLGRHGLGFGVRVGGDLLMQRYTQGDSETSADQLVPRVGPFVRAELGLGGSVALLLDAGADVHFIDVAPSDPFDRGASTRQARFVPTASLGLAVLVW